ncbi:MAG: hypothetical protein EBU96_04210 [Actinobacteria bacterium]|nr:hypothetical protein [Actinomycetota bacterium]
MATLDLGKIKFVYKGTYSGATTYETDDVVSYLGSAYIYTNATSASGNLPTDTTYWSVLASGANLSVLTAGGDLAYGTGASAGAIAKLAAGTSGTILTSNGAGNAPSWQSAAQVARPSNTAGLLLDKRNARGYNFSIISTTSNEILGCGAGQDVGSAHGCGNGGANNSWGFGTAQLPSLASDDSIFNIKSTSYNSFVITTKGRLFATGLNTEGQLGLGLLSGGGPTGSVLNDITNRYYFEEVIFPTTNYPTVGQNQTPVIVDVFPSTAEAAARRGSTYAIDSLGYLWCWGSNTNSRLGFGSTDANSRYCPVRHPYFTQNSIPANTNISQPAGQAVNQIKVRTVVLEDASDTIVCLVDPSDINNASQSNLFYWGANSSGLFGNGTAASTTTYQATPANYPRSYFNLTNSNANHYVYDITMNRYNVDTVSRQTLYVVVRNNDKGTNVGNIYACGDNAVGQCCDTTTTNRTTYAALNGVPVGRSVFLSTLGATATGFDRTSTTTVQNSVQLFAARSPIICSQGAAFVKFDDGTYMAFGYNNISSPTNKTTLTAMLFGETNVPSPGQTGAYPAGTTSYSGPAPVLSTTLTTASGKYIVEIAIGGQTNIGVALVRFSDGTIYSAGYNYYGACGCGKSMNAGRDYSVSNDYNYIFKKCLLNPKIFNASTISQISVDGQYDVVSRIRLASGELYSCGYNGGYISGESSNNSSTPGFLGAMCTGLDLTHDYGRIYGKTTSQFVRIDLEN